MQKVAFVCASTGLALSLLVHVASFFGVSLLRPFSFLWVVVVVLGVAAAFSRRGRTLRDLSPLAIIDSTRVLPDGSPRWVTVAVFGSILYSAVTFLVTIVATNGQEPGVSGDRYVMEFHGSVVREITEAQYRWQLAHQTGMWSSLWLSVFAFSLLAFWHPTRSPSGDGHSKAGG